MKSPVLLFLLHSTAPFVIIWKAWGYSSAGRAFEWHSKGQRFDPAYLHHSFNPPHLFDVVLFIHSPHRNKWLTRFHASFHSFGIGSLLCRCLISLFQLHISNTPLSRHKWLTRFHASLHSFGIGSLLNRFDPAYLHHVFNPPHLSDVVLFIHSPHRNKWLTRFHASLCSFEIGLPFAILGTKLISSETCWFIPVQTAKKNGASCTTFQKSD